MEKRLLVPVVALSLVVVMAGCGSKSANTVAEKSGGAGVTTADVKKADSKKAEEPVAKTAPGSFSAEMVTNLPGGKSATSKMVVDGENKMRMEAMGQIIIVRRDKGKMWMLNEADKSAMEMPVNEQMIKEASKAKFDKSKLKAVGKETVEGYLCDKYVATDKGATTTTWVARKLGLPVKIESGNTVVLFKNINVGKQSASLFELDPGYKVIKMPDMPAMPDNMPKNVPMPKMPQ